MQATLSVIIPARNEEALIGQCVGSVVKAVSYAESEILAASAEAPRAGSPRRFEVIVVDNQSTDRTGECVQPFVERHGVVRVNCEKLGTACARNCGVAHSTGAILCFLDADSMIPPHALVRVTSHVENGYRAGITKLESLERGLRATLWWAFWNEVRRLPLPRAKAMPAFMFCTRELFDDYGPFREDYAIGEEWRILARLYRTDPKRFIYDRELIVRSSSRRMELQRFGYTKTAWKYCQTVLIPWGRGFHSDRFRHRLEK